jgi:hypothetical protein
MRVGSATVVPPGATWLHFCKKFSCWLTGLDHGIGHSVLSVLSYRSARWTQGRWWYLDRCENRGTHCPRFLPETPLRRRRPVRAREETVVDSRQACTLSGMSEPSQLVTAERERPVAPFHGRPGALEPRRALRRCARQGVLLHWAQCSYPSSGRTPRWTAALGQRPKRRARGQGAGRG